MKDKMKQPAHSLVDIEPRWPTRLTILLVFSLKFLPGRVRAFPPWVACLLVAALISPMILWWLSLAKERWLRLESIVTYCSFQSLGLE